jgi:hypothetical protein
MFRKFVRNTFSSLVYKIMQANRIVFTNNGGKHGKQVKVNSDACLSSQTLVYGPPVEKWDPVCMYSVCMYQRYLAVFIMLQSRTPL